MTVDTADAGERPFGACVHMDHIVMREGSAATRTAKVALNITDDKTDLKAAMPARGKSASAIIESVHIFEGPELGVRRWWTAGALEFALAASRIRPPRPLAHYKSIPHRPQSSGVAERSNKMVIEGERRSILQSGLNEDSWPFAVQHWCMNYNASRKTRDGNTPWSIRFGRSPDFRIYPLGALVFFKGVAGFDKCEKWADKLIPALLVGVPHGPGMQWDKTYRIVPLGAMLGQGGSGRRKQRSGASMM